MAPIFDTTASPTPAFKPSKAPTFAFNTHSRSSSQGNGFFKSKTQSPATTKQKQHSRGSSEESWDNMNGDFGSDGQNDDDDSRISYGPEDSNMDDEEEEAALDMYEAEIQNFAFELDETIDQDDNGELVGKEGSGFELVRRFQDLAAQQVHRFRELGQDDEQDQDVVDSELKYWELEHQTWELFGQLAEHRLDERPHTKTIPNDLVRNRFLSNKHVRDYLEENHPKFRELALVLDWLERYSPHPDEELRARDGGLKADAGWLYTREKIKANKRKGGRGSFSFGSFGNKGRDVVNALDPDAATREQKRLEEEDEVADRLLMKLCWKFLRKGDVTTAQLLCEDSGETWRAVSLGGGQEAWDDRIDGEVEVDGDQTIDDMEKAVRGNKRRELWKRMCFALARRPEVDTYEKAVYGALCGDIESVVPACETWEDYLFAHFNSLVEAYYTSTLANTGRLSAGAQQFPTFDSIAYHSLGASLFDDKTILPRIIDSVTAQCKDIADAHHPMRVIQGALISGRLTDKISQIDRQFKLLSADPMADHQEPGTDVDITDVRLLRVLVHMILSLGSIGAGFEPGTEDHAKAETAIGAYINILGQLEKFELMPLYAKRLTPQKAIEVLGKEMILVDGESRRQDVYGMMGIHGVDIDACLRYTMKLAFKEAERLWDEYAFDHETLATGFEGDINDEESQLISALKWLVLGGESLRADAIISASEVYKKFLIAGRLPALRALNEHVKTEDIIPASDGYANGADGDDDDSMMLESPTWQTRETTDAKSICLSLENLTNTLIALEDWKLAVRNRHE